MRRMMFQLSGFDYTILYYPKPPSPTLNPRLPRPQTLNAEPLDRESGLVSSLEDSEMILYCIAKSGHQAADVPTCLVFL